MDDNVLILHLRIYDFIKYIHHFLNTYPTNERYSLEKYIRDTLYDCLTEVIKYEKSGTISHVYSIDTNIALLKDYFKLSRDLGVKCINEKRIIVITRKLDEMGRLVGGIILAKNGKKKKNFLENIRTKNKVISPISFDYNPEVIEPVIFDSAFKFNIVETGVELLC